MKIRTRFAPSSTGCLHLGGARTALYSWLFARQHNGEFVLRIEDTDPVRSKPEFVKTIIDGMNWLNLKWDKGPYFQSRRLRRYNDVMRNMLLSGTAYKCYCSKQRLDSLRQEQIANGKKPRYDGRCRFNHIEEQKMQKPFVIRFANPKEGGVIFEDQIRGKITCSNQELDDLIIRRTDGFPTYNFCSVVDDWDMRITHVIRGEDHIKNTARQINIFEALKAPIPIYAHVSMIHDDNGEKLSKRHGATSIMWYRKKGYLPEAVLNHLVRLGWSSGNQEIFSQEEMIKLFSLEKVSKSGSTFNSNKLLWLNHYYINTMSPVYVETCLRWQIEQAKIDIQNGPKPIELINLFGKRCKTLKEIVESCRYLYEEFDEFDLNAAKKYLSLEACFPLKTFLNKLNAISEWTEKKVSLTIQETANELKIGMYKIGMPLRVALTGSDRSPALDLTVHAIGKRRCVTRIKRALDFIEKRANEEQ